MGAERSGRRALDVLALLLVKGANIEARNTTANGVVQGDPSGPH